MVKYDLEFVKPLMNASGMLGFVPDGRGVVDLERLGAFVTNPISLTARSPAHGTRFLSYPGGFLIHSGHPNPGIKAALRHYASRWARSPLPVIVHLLATEPDRLTEMAQRLERAEGVVGIEVGLPPGATIETAVAFAHAAAAGDHAVLLRLPFELAREIGGAAAGQLAARLAEAGVLAASLGPPRGALPGPDGHLVFGRLYGPAIFPLALIAVQALVHAGLNVIGAGGIYSGKQIEAMLAAGAAAVQIDAALWLGGWEKS